MIDETKGRRMRVCDDFACALSDLIKICCKRTASTSYDDIEHMKQNEAIGVLSQATEELVTFIREGK